MLIGRWTYAIPLQLQSHNHVVVYSYYLVFIAYISYSFITGAGKALAHIQPKQAPIVRLVINMTSLRCCGAGRLGFFCLRRRVSIYRILPE